MSAELVRSLITTIRYACKEGINGLRLTYPELKRYQWKVTGGDNDCWSIILPYSVGADNFRLVVNLKQNRDTCKLTIYSRKLDRRHRIVQFPKSLEVHLPTRTDDESSITQAIKHSFDWATCRLSTPRGGAN